MSNIFDIIRYNDFMENTPRETILLYLSLHPNTPIEELCSVLSLSRTAALYHLKQLQSEGKIHGSESQQDFEFTQGRPRKYYSLTTQSRPNNFALLSDAFINSLSKLDDHGESFLYEIAKTLAGPAPAGSMLNRISHLVTRLNEMHYSAYWQAGPNGPNIYLANCPYASIRDSHPILCRLDALIIQHIVGVPVQMEISNDLNGNCATECIFQASIP